MDAFIDFVTGLPSNFPELSLDIKRVIGEVSTLSLPASRSRPRPRTPAQASTDTFLTATPTFIGANGERWDYRGPNQEPKKAIVRRPAAEVVQWILTAGRFPADPAVLQGGILLLETSEELISTREFGWIVRSLGERGLLEAVEAVLVARPPTSSLEIHHTSEQRAAHRAEQRDVAIEMVHRYNSDAIVLVGVPFGHTRPQWILPYGGQVTVDSTARKLWADYS